MEATVKHSLFARNGDTPAEATPVAVRRELLDELRAQRERIEGALEPSKRHSVQFYVDQALRRGIDALHNVEPIHNPFAGS